MPKLRKKEMIQFQENVWNHGRKDERTFQSTVGDPIKLLSSLCKPSYLKYVLLMHLHIAKNLHVVLQFS